MRPSGYSRTWKVCSAPLPNCIHSGTRTQLTTNRPGSASMRTPDGEAVGSRSSNSGAMRGGPAVMRPSDRSVKAASPAPKVKLPSELMYTEW